MESTYKLTPIRKIINIIMRASIRWNIGPSGRHILVFKGRKSGKTYSTPVTLVQENGRSWLVAPYGEVSWVKNVRAAGSVELERGGKTMSYRIKELSPSESGPILKTYLPLEPITQPYFAARPESPVVDFVKEAAAHPVFALSNL
jgi:deazaflavin-dependent oxidoreductase (nitroreductase family)